MYVRPGVVQKADLWVFSLQNKQGYCDARLMTKKQKNFLLARIPTYLAGIFIMTMGISLSVKSNLGVSPGSAVPYTMTCVWGLEMGVATILFHFLLVFLQIILLGNRFKIKNVMQAAASIILGYFTTFCNWCFRFFPDPQIIAVKMGLLLVSCFLIAFGMFLYVETKITPFAVVGTIIVISELTGMSFPKTKILCDVFMSIFSLSVCLLKIGDWGSIGIGTLITAVLVGIIMDRIALYLGDWRAGILQIYLK